MPLVLTIFFVNVGVNLAKSIKSPSECVAIRDYLGEKQVDTLFLHPCDNVEVINVVKNFKNKTSTDCNDFSMYFVKVYWLCRVAAFGVAVVSSADQEWSRTSHV